MNNKNIIEKLTGMLEIVNCNGADYSEIYIQKSRGHSIYFEDGVIEETGSSIAGGAGVRIIVGENEVYVHSPLLDGEEIIASVLEGAENLGIHLSVSELKPDMNSSLKFEKLEFPFPGTAFMKEIDNYIRGKSTLVKQVTMRHDISAKNILILKAGGEPAEDTRWYSTFSVQVIAGKDGILQTASESMAYSVNPERFWELADPFKGADKALARALMMLDAPECPAGTMKVVLSGEAGGTMIHEACGHGLEADIMQKDFSVYSDMMGKKVASPLVTMVDDGTLKEMYGSYVFDDEGNLSKRNILIENGILKGQLTDYMSSIRGGLELSGNGRRSSYKNMPIPRMSNTYLLPGKSDPEDIISKVDRGLFVKRMGGGEVNPTSGDFVFKITEGYMIDRGKVTTPVRGAILTGNGPQVLNDIIDIGNDLTFMPGVCGKSGQSVAVTDGQPTILIEKLTVGGNDLQYEIV